MIAQSLRSNGVPVVLRPDSPNPIETSGIFQAATIRDDVGDTRTRQPSFVVTIPGADAVRVKKGTILTVDGRRYVVRSLGGDGALTRRLVIGFTND